MSNPYTENVRRGSEALTAHFGEDSWKKEINKKLLNMNNCWDCICGQLFESLGHNCPVDDTSEELGFFAGIGGEPDILKEAWLEELAR